MSFCLTLDDINAVFLLVLTLSLHLYSYHELKRSGDMKGIIYNGGGLFMYLFIIYMSKLIIWVDGYMLSLFCAIPSCSCV